MNLLALYHVAAISVLVGLGLQLAANRRRLRRLDPGARPPHEPSVSVLIPARNEAGRIAGCAHAWTRQEYADFEVLIYDDESTDDTAARAVAASSERVRVLSGEPLPAGWRGKPHACHRLRTEARGEVLVFADADITPDPETLAAATAMLARTGAAAISALPLHTGRGLLVRLLASIQNWSALTFLPTWAAPAARRSTFAALNGQFLVIRGAVYDEVGGFAAVRGSLAEDTELGRLLVGSGHQVSLVDGSKLLRCEPYTSLPQAWSANLRNLVPIFFGSSALLAAAVLGLAALYLVPWLLLASGLVVLPRHPWLLMGLPALEIAYGLTTRRLCDAFFGYPWRVTLLHPLAVVALLVMGFASIIRHRLRRTVPWRGRSYRLGDEAAEIWH